MKPIHSLPRPLRRLFATTSCVLIAVSHFFPIAIAEDTNDPRKVIEIQNRGETKVVVQVTTGDVSKGLHKGLSKLEMLVNGYTEAGIAKEDLEIRAVFHGDAADFTLTDEAWNRVRKETGGNPNTQFISELSKKGVRIELCNNRRVKNGWAKSDVHPAVNFASSAYHRILDLQQQGYAYVRL